MRVVRVVRVASRVGMARRRRRRRKGRGRGSALKPEVSGILNAGAEGAASFCCEEEEEEEEVSGRSSLGIEKEGALKPEVSGI